MWTIETFCIKQPIAKRERPNRCERERPGWTPMDRISTRWCTLDNGHGRDIDHEAGGVRWDHSDPWQLSKKAFRRFVRHEIGRTRRLFWRRGAPGNRSVFFIAWILKRRIVISDNRLLFKCLHGESGPEISAAIGRMRRQWRDINFLPRLLEILRAEGKGPVPCPEARI